MNKKVIQTILLLLLVVFQSKAVLSQSAMTANLEYGPYAIGFDVVHQYDSSRTFGLKYHENGSIRGHGIYRPIQTLVWYPSNQIRVPTNMEFGDYFYLIGSETNFDISLTEEMKREIINRVVEGNPTSKNHLVKEIQQPVKAVMGIDMAKGKFPVVIYAPSLESLAFENSVMCEYLASHGFIVISSPSLGYEKRSVPIEFRSFETQSRDIEFLIEYSKSIKNAKLTRNAIIGFSFGGMSSVLAQIRNIEIDAMVFLDGSIHDYYGEFQRSDYYQISKFDVPSLFISTSGYIDRKPFYEELKYSESYAIDFEKLNHTSLASYFIQVMNEDENFIPERLNLNNQSYEIISKYVKEFLDYTLNDHSSGKTYLKNTLSQNKITLEGVNLSSKPRWPSPLLFKFSVQREGFDKVLEVYENYNSKYDGYNISEKELNLWAGELISGNQKPAKKVLTLINKMHPDTSFAARSFAYSKDWNKVLQWFEAVAHISTINKIGYDQLNRTAHILHLDGERELSLEIFKLNATLNEKSYRAIFNLGWGYYYHEKFELAKEAFEKALTLNPDDRYTEMSNSFLTKITSK